METVWVLKTYGSRNLKAFAIEELGLAAYREYIEERTSGMDWYDENFEWHDKIYPDEHHRACYCYGEFVASLDGLKINYGKD